MTQPQRSGTEPVQRARRLEGLVRVGQPVEQLEAVAERIGEPQQSGNPAGRQLVRGRCLHLDPARPQMRRGGLQCGSISDLPAEIGCAAAGMHEQAVRLGVDPQRQPCGHGLDLHGEDAAGEVSPRREIFGEDPCVAQRLDVHVDLLSA